MSDVVYKYTTSYFPVSYHPGDLNANPDPASLLGSGAYQDHLDRMGDAGWKLVAVQPLLAGSGHPGATYGYGYSTTAGFYLFFRRKVSSP